MNTLQIQTIKLTDIQAYKNNPKLHNKAQVAKIRESIREFGFINPVLLDRESGNYRRARARDGGARHGHGRGTSNNPVASDGCPETCVSHRRQQADRAW